MIKNRVLTSVLNLKRKVASGELATYETNEISAVVPILLFKVHWLDARP